MQALHKLAAERQLASVAHKQFASLLLLVDDSTDLRTTALNGRFKLLPAVLLLPLELSTLARREVNSFAQGRPKCRDLDGHDKVQARRVGLLLGRRRSRCALDWGVPPS